jgi:hypothetical protein
VDGTSLACGLLGLIEVVGTALAGCGLAPTPPAPTQQAAALYFMLDANAVVAKSNSDLRYGVVALDTRDGHVAWQHQLETPSRQHDRVLAAALAGRPRLRQLLLH